MKAYTLGMYEKAVPNELSWKEKLEAARTAGYDFFEISIDETEEKLNRLKMSGEERQKLCQLKQQPADGTAQHGDYGRCHSVCRRFGNPHDYAGRI